MDKLPNYLSSRSVEITTWHQGIAQLSYQHPEIYIQNINMINKLFVPKIYCS